MTEIEIGQHFITRSDEATEETNEIFLLSRAELDFLKGTKKVSSNYERVLLHRINKKLAFFRDEVLPALMRNRKTVSWVESITENCNRITNFSNDASKLAKLQDSLFSQNNEEKWWAGPDLNRGPSACQADVLTKLDDRPSMGFKLVSRFVLFILIDMSSYYPQSQYFVSFVRLRILCPLHPHVLS